MYLLFFIIIALPLFSLDHVSVSWEYNQNKQLDSLTLFSDQPSPRTMEYTYTPDGKISSVHKPDGVVLNYTYNDAGQLTSLDSSDDTVHITYTYDLEGNLLEPEQPGITYGHNQLILPDGSAIFYEWNGDKMVAVHRLDKEGNTLYTHRYHWEGETFIDATLPLNVGQVTYSYDLEGKLREITSPFTTELIPTGGYDEEGHLTHIIETDPVGEISHKFTYDTEGQIISEKWGDTSSNYTYDPLQNRHKADSYNQVINTPTHSYDYNLNGYITQIDDLKLTYDALDRLTAVESDRLWRVTYTYDYLHRRRSKKIEHYHNRQWSLQKELFYLYDHFREMGTVDREGNILELRVLGTGIGADIGAAIAIEKDGKIYIPLYDHRGNVRSLIDAHSKKPVQTYRYSAFGEEELYDASGRIADYQALTPWRFSSKRYDSETGWIFYGKRYYSPDQARWTSPDPLGLGNHSNAYLFLYNHPIDQIDLYGLFSLSALWQNMVHTCQKWYTTFHSYYKSIDLENLKLEFYKKMMGRGLFRLSPFYNSEGPCTGVHPGHRDDKTRITFINGIMNSATELTDDILPKISATHNGHEITYVYRGTQGWTRDIFECVLVKVGVISNNAQNLAAIWKKMIEEMGGTEGGGKIIHYAHSIGGTETLRARLLLSPEEQKMISVTIYGPATMLPSTGFSSVLHFVSRRDGVCYLDPVGYVAALWNQPENIIFLGAHSGGYPFVDHLFENYWNYLKEVFEEKS